MKLRIRKSTDIFGAASTMGPSFGKLKAGYRLEAEAVVQGEEIKGNDRWYRDPFGFFYWSGTVELLDEAPPQMEFALAAAPAPRANPLLVNPLPWHIKDFGIDKIWQHTMGADVKIAILDTGVNTGHPDLQGAMVWGKNYLTDGGPQNTADVDGHGSMCASVALGRGTRANGALGVAPAARLMIGRVLPGRLNEVEVRFLIQAIQDAVANQAAIISISLGTVDFLRSELQQAIRDAVRQNVIVVAAAGNRAGSPHPNSADFPASFPEVIAAGALNKDGTPWDGTIMDSTVPTYFCPANEIHVAAHSGAGTIPISIGATSMAAPYLAGLIALTIASHAPRSVSAQQIINALKKSSIPLGVAQSFKINPEKFFQLINI